MKRRLVIAFGITSLCLLAVGLLVRFKTGGVSYHGHTVKFWVRELTAPDTRRRESATATFQTLGSNAVPALAKLLRQRDTPLHQKAWELAGKLPSRLGDLVRRQVGPLDATAVRANAARALTLLGPQAQAAVPALSQTLHDADLQVRWQAGQALGHIGPAGMPALAARIHDPDTHVRYCAVSGLGCAGPGAASLAAPALFTALADTNSMVSSWASQILASLGTNAAPFLTNMMASADSRNRQRAAKALGSVRSHPWAVPPLVQMLHGDPDPACRAVAIQTLTRLGLPDLTMLRAYLEALKDPEVNVRLEAVRALGQARFQARLAVPGLTACLEDSSPEVREAAARALDKLK